MTWALRHAPCCTASAMRRDVYAGEVFLLPSTGASERLVAGVRSELADALGCTVAAIRDAPQQLANADLFARIGKLRRALYLEPRYHDAIRDVIGAFGFDPARVAFDPLRLRVIQHDGHHNPLAAPVYHPHRDTWYAHPRALIAWWIPLDALAADETFVFYPERFAAPVPNDSEVFDYDDWVRDGWELKIGWQQLAAGIEARYPCAHSSADGGPPVGFACRAAQNLVFSGAQFHATLPQSNGRTRFSLDFRIVDLDDHAAGLGAPDVDNRSRGSALRDYVEPG